MTFVRVAAVGIYAELFVRGAAQQITVTCTAFNAGDYR